MRGVRPPLIVLDTDVLVSGLRTPHGPPGRIVELATAALVRIAYDDRVIDEYRRVIARPRLRLEPQDAAVVIDLLMDGGLQVIAAPLPLTLPDVMDLPLVEVAAAAGADALVTGNARHYTPLSGASAVPVRSPREFLEALRTAE